MNLVKQYLLGKPEALEDYPFGEAIAVFKVKKKMFATYAKNSDAIWNINLKCDPQEAMMLRDVFEAVTPGYHMNKAHWNSVQIPGDVPQHEVERMIDHSYGLVVKKLTKVEKNALELSYGTELIYR